MGKPVRSSLQNLIISYEFALAIGNSLDMSEMLNEVIHKMVHKTNAHRGIIWVKNGGNELQPVASAGINIEDVLAQGEIMGHRDVLNQIQKSRQFVLRYKDDTDFLQYCPVITEKEESVLIIPVTDVAIIHLVYASRDIADEPLANLLASLSKKLSVAIEACTAHKNIVNEVQVRVEAEAELKKKTEKLISSEKELKGLYRESEQARKSLLSILEDVARKEAALKESESKLSSILSSIDDLVFVFDQEDRFTLAHNTKSEQLYTTPDEFIGKKPFEVLPSHLKNIFLDAFDDIRKGKVAEYDYWLKIEGNTIWFSAKHSPRFVDGELMGSVAVVRDITERKRAEEALKESERLLRDAQEVAHIGSYGGDLKSEEGVWSEELYHIYGYSPGEVSITPEFIRDHIHPDDMGVWSNANEALITSNMPYDVEYRIIRKDAEVRTVRAWATLKFNSSGAPERMAGMLQDITERKRIEKALNDRVEFEKIVASISTSFINLAPDEIDNGIEDALGSIGEFSGVDRSYLFRLSDDGTKTDNTHEWCAREIVPQIENLKGLQTADFPWFLERLNRFETVHIPSVADLPTGADAEKGILQSGDILSAILVPMVYGKTLVGFIGLDSVRQEKSWSEDDIALLRIVCEIFVSAMERMRVMDAIQSSETKFHAIFEENPLGAVIIDKERKIREVNDAAVVMVGRLREEIIGRTCHEFICPREEKDCPIYNRGLIIDHDEGILISKDRGDVPVEKTATQITVDGDMMILEMFYDITKRKAAEEEIRKKTDELEKFNSLAVGRELKMIELKKEINALLEESGKAPVYKIVGAS